MFANAEDDVPFTEAELSQLRGLNSDFWDAEDFSQHALFRDELPADISQDATLTALQLISEEELISGSEQLKHWREVGNQLYKDSLAFEQLNNIDLKKRRLRDAISAYTRALKAECDSQNELKSRTHANRALCFFKLGKYAESVDDAKYAIVKNPQNLKGYFHAARSSLALGLHKRALSFIDEAYKQLPVESCSDLVSLRAQLTEILDSRRAAAEHRKSQTKKSELIVKKVLEARNIKWRPTNPFGAPLGQPTITESNLVAWPILILIDEFSVSEALDLVEESASVKNILDGFFSQDLGWNPTKEYNSDNVMLSIWTGAIEAGSEEEADVYSELTDPDEPLHSVINRCSTIHRYLVMKLRRRTF